MPKNPAYSMLPDDNPSENPVTEPAAVVDASGHQCPVPLLMTRQAAKNLSAGEVLCVISTDNHTGLDLEAWCLRFGHALLRQETIGEQHKVWIQLGE